MSLVFSFVDHNEIYSIRNPLDRVTIPASEETHEEVNVLLPRQVIVLAERLPYPVKIAMLLVASAGVRISECLAFRWSHVEWNESKIKIEQTFRRVGVGLVFLRQKTMAGCKCLCGKQIWLVGAAGFEPATSTV
jgi:integrase